MYDIFHHCSAHYRLCLSATDKDNRHFSLGSFLSSPHKAQLGNDIRLVYTEGSFCDNRKSRIQTILTLKCKPGRLPGEKLSFVMLLLLLHFSCLLAGDLESAPVLRSVSSDGCKYELEWYTAAACVLSKTQGDDCKVEDAQAGTTQKHSLLWGWFLTDQYFT